MIRPCPKVQLSIYLDAPVFFYCLGNQGSLGKDTIKNNNYHQIDDSDF